MEILQKYTGESLTIGIAISDGYDLANIESIKLYLAGKIYPHTLEERMIRCEITSDQTALLYGAKSLWLFFDDAVHGVRKYNLGDIEFNQNKAKESNESVNTGFDVVIPLTITETTVTVGSVVYNYFKGTDGIDGKDRYQSYLDTTDDDPVLTEQEWSAKPEIVAQYSLTIKNEDAQYEGIWLKIPHTTTVNNKLIKILSAKCRIGNGIVDMDLIINYPSAPTYTGTGIYSGFYILDRSGLIKPTSEFEYITIEYDIEDDTITKYNFKRLTLGKNVISSHRKDSTGDTSNEVHAMSMRCAFIAAYGTFGYEYVDTYYDETANYGDLIPAFEPTYYEGKDANLLMRPYSGAALGENPNSNPDFLEVGAHGHNSYVRYDLTTSADVLLTNAIAVGARPVNDWQTTAGCTTYGYGMEFFESTEMTYLLNKYPQRGLDVSPFLATQIWSNAQRTQVWTENANHVSVMDWYEIGDKVFININLEAPTFGGTHSNVWTFRYNPESVICTITDIIIDGGVKKFVLDQPIWDTQVVGKYMWAFLPMAYACGTTNGSTQSPATMIVGAKMRLIKDTTGFSYKQVRMACRETAVLENETTTVSSDLDGDLTTIPVVSTADFPNEGIIKIGNYKFTYTSKTSTSFIGLAQRIVIANGTEVSLLWDIYRGFGQIDEEAAIEYLQNKYTNDAEFVKQEAAYLDSIHYISPVLTYDDILDNSPVPKRLAGKGEISRELISTEGLVKTYRITYTDNTTFEYSVSDGEQGATGAQGVQGEKGDKGDKGETGETGKGITSIVRTSGNGAAGTTDTYTITFTDSTTTTFQVVNGANGTGATVVQGTGTSTGNVMSQKSVTDELAKKTFIFETYTNLLAGVETTIAGTAFSPILNLRPLNIQVFLDGVLKEVTVKYVQNGGNYDIKLTSTVDLIGCVVSVLSTQIQQPEFITLWNTELAGSATKTIVIPVYSNGYNCVIDWGDGTSETYIGGTLNTAGTITHVYSTTGIKMIKISGTFPRIYFNNTGDKLKIINIKNWGTNVWTSMEKAFNGCANLVGSYTDIPNTANVTNMSNMWNGCSLFNSPVNYNTASVTNFLGIYQNCTMFNQSVAGHNTANALYLQYMFAGCTRFNQSIAHFNVAKVTNMSAFLSTAKSFSLANYNAMLASFAAQVLKPNVVFDCVSTYTDTVSKAVLTSAPNTWTITDYGVAPFSNGKLVISFDDSKNTFYSKAKGIFEAKGVRATSYVIASTIGSDGFMTWSQITELNGLGFDMQCHTNSSVLLTTLTEAQVKASYDAVDSAFVANGLTAPLHTAYPGGVSNAKIKTWTATKRLSARGTNQQIIRRGFDMFDLSSVSISSETLAELTFIKPSIDSAFNNRCGIILYAHGIDGVGDITTAQLNAIIDYAQSIGMDIITYSQLYTLLISI